MSDINTSFAFKHGFTVCDEILTAIGCTVVCQSLIETQLSNLIIKLVDTETQKGLIFTSVMSFKNLCSTLSSLVLQIVKETDISYKQFKELMGVLQHFEEFRNQITHSVWAHDPKFSSQCAARFKITAKQGKGLKHQREEVEVARISEEINKATLAQAKLCILVSEMAGKPIETIKVS